MKLLQLGKFYHPERGGMESHLQYLCAGLRDRYELKVVVANRGRGTLTETVDDVFVTRVGSLGEFAATSICPTMFSHINRCRADITHIHFPNPMAHLAYLMSKKEGRSKLVITWHSDIVKQKKLLRLYTPFLNNILDRCDRIIVTSENYLNSSPFLDDYHSKCRVIPLGVDTSRFIRTDKVVEGIRSVRAQHGNGPLILFVGRLAQYKGIKYLVEAMKSVAGRCLIVGTGKEEGNIRADIFRLGLEDRVAMCGDVGEDMLPAYYHAADIVALPSISRNEAFGMVQLEAFACGKPVVSTDIDSGVPFVNKDRESGLIVKPKDSMALVAALSELISNDRLREDCGQSAMNRVNKYFTVERMVDKTVELYEELI